MAADAAAGPRATRSGSSRRFWLWTGLVAFVVWHATFDLTIDRGMKAYVAAADRHAEGRGPVVSIRESMARVRADGARWGLAGVGVVAAAAALGRAVWARRSPRT